MTAAAGEIAIRLRGLVKRFEKHRALAGIDVVLDGPQIVGIIGPDGAGKTTLLRAMVGLLDVEATSATVLGYDLMAPDLRDMKARVGYVPQAFSLHRDLSITENLRFTARLHRMPEAERVRRATPLLEQVGLAAFGDRAAGALSGGMKQKLAIVNALLPEPDLLVLDEPTAAMDAEAEVRIFEHFRTVTEDRMAILISHRFSTVRMADHIVVLADGRVVEEGSHETLMARGGPYARLFTLQAAGYR